MNGSADGRGLLRVALVIFALFLAYRFLAGIAAAVLVLLVGLFLAVALSGPVEWLHRRKVPRPVASASIVASLVGAFALGVYLFLPVLAEQASQVLFALPFALSALGGWVERLAGQAGVPVGQINPSSSTLISLGRDLAGGALGLFGSLASFAFGLVVVFFVPLYLASSPEPALDWTLRLFPPERRPRVREVLGEVRSRLLSWIEGRLISMAIVGALSVGALYLIGIPGAFFLGVFTGLLEFVPYFGPIISAVPPTLLALGGHPLDAAWVALAYLAIQQIEGNLITPLIMHETTSLHPVVVVAAVTVAGAAFGVLGSLVAVPTAVVVMVLVEELWFPRVEAKEGGQGRTRTARPG